MSTIYPKRTPVLVDYTGRNLSPTLAYPRWSRAPKALSLNLVLVGLCISVSLHSSQGRWTRSFSFPQYILNSNLQAFRPWIPRTHTQPGWIIWPDNQAKASPKTWRSLCCKHGPSFEGIGSRQLDARCLACIIPEKHWRRLRNRWRLARIQSGCHWKTEVDQACRSGLLALLICKVVMIKEELGVSPQCLHIIRISTTVFISVST